MSSSESFMRRLRDQRRQIATRAKLNPVPRLLILAGLFGVGAGFFVPEVPTREQADIALLLANMAIIAAYVGIARRRKQNLRISSLVILGLGSLACAVSLAHIPLSAFQVTFALGIASFVYGLLATLILLA